MAGLIACKDARLCEAFSCPWPPSSRFYTLREIERGTYARLAEGLRQEQIASLRLSYRSPDVLHECILDVLAGVASRQHRGTAPVVLVRHSLSGAVVIAAGVVHALVAGVVALAQQTYGVQMAGQLAPHPLLVVHGKADTRLSYACGSTLMTEPRNRNSSSSTTAPSTASTHVPQRSNSF